MSIGDIPDVVVLQKAAFPPPFSDDLHWDRSHLERHLRLFPAAQFVAEADGNLVGSCSNTLIEEERWQAHGNWIDTVGGPFLDRFSPTGSTLYGLDITVHPDFRRIGVGRALYEERFRYVRALRLVRYGTGCRIPDFSSFATRHPDTNVDNYVDLVVRGDIADRTLTPLLRMGLTFLEVVPNYMEDAESADCAALLEWLP